MDLPKEPTKREALVQEVQEFLRINGMKNVRIDTADDYTDCVSNADKLYVEDAVVEYFLAKTKTEKNHENLSGATCTNRRPRL